MINKIIANIRKGGGKIYSYVTRSIVALICFISITANAANVYYVTPEADGTGGGTSWSDATTLAGANGKVAVGDTIRMKAGTYTMTECVTISKAITVEGGYKGEIDDDLTLADEPVTTLDGANSSSVLQAVHVTSTSETTRFYRISFVRCYNHGILKTGAGSLEMYDCRLANNGANAVLKLASSFNNTIGGRGGLFRGSTTSSYLVLSNCVVEGNVHTKIRNSGSSSDWYHSIGEGASIWDFKRVFIDDCLFTSNGVPADCNNNYFRSGYPSTIYLKNAPVTARNTSFKGNSCILPYGYNTGTTHLSGACGGSVFTNCQWVGNRGDHTTSASTRNMQSAVYVELSNNTDEVDFENCTIAYNIMGTGGGCAAGLTANKGIANVRNSILYGNVVFKANTTSTTDADVMAHSNGKVNLSNSMTSADLTGKNNINLNNVIYGDPLFVTPLTSFYECINATGITPISSLKPTDVHFKAGAYEKIMNLDVHLLSADGYFDNSGKYYQKGSTDVSSIAIDAGSVDSDYSNEPMPNGGVVNLGCYGNTPEASNSPSGGQPTLAADDVVVTFTEYGQPTITVTPKAADSSKYKAIVSITVTGKVKGSGVIAEETKTFDFSKAGIEPGNLVEMAIQEIFEPDSQLSVSVTVAADGAEDVSVEKTVSVSGTLPECYGRGNNNVVHYWADAPGRNDGSSWVHAYRDLSSALAALTAEKSELWVGGSNVLHASTATLSSTFNSTIRGGFTEYCDTLEEREAGAISVLDGSNTYSPFSVSVSGGVTCFIERMKICRSGTRNITKSGSGILSMFRCVISDCAKTEQGVGIYLSGGENLFDSCQFKNLKYSSHECAGAALYVTDANKVLLKNCVFEKNGDFDSHYARDGHGGIAVYSFDAPVIADGCKFIGNVERVKVGSSAPPKDDGEYKRLFRSAGCVTLHGSCSDSAFTNCLWLGNCSSHCNYENSMAGVCKVGTSTNSAAVVVSLRNASDTVDFANCTFAYNMSDSALSSTGILMLKGKGNAVNSIFTGAVTGTCSRVANQVYVNKGSSMTLDYCMFDAEGDYGAAEGGTVTASNIMYGDPRLVYSRDDFATGGNVDLVNGIYNSNGSGINSVLANANAHLSGGTGYTDEKSGLVVKGSRLNKSPAIDAGKPGYDYSLEPQPNGRRVNLGFYGNTPWATMSDRRGMRIIIR